MEELGYWVIGITAVYYVALIAVGWIGRKYSKTVEDYSTGGGVFSTIALGIASFATWMSASSWMGVPAMAFRYGWPFWWHAIAITIAPTIGSILVGLKLKRDADKLKAISLTDYYGHRFNSPFIRILITVFILVWTLALCIAQFKCAGTVFSYSLGVPYILGVLIGSIIIVIYLPMGGFMAATASDIWEGVLMVFSAILLVPTIFSAAGSFADITAKMAAIDPQYAQVFHPPWTPLTAFTTTLYWLMWYVAAPYLGRFYICLRKPDWREILKFMIYFQIGQTFGQCLFLTGYGALALGIKPKPPFGYDLAIVEFGMRYVPPILTPLLGVAFVGVLAAVLSSVEDFVHTSSVELGHTVFEDLIPQLKGREKLTLWICRLIVIAIIVAGILYAIYSPPPLLSIFMYHAASPLLAASFLVLMIGLYHKSAKKIAVEIAALAAVVAALASYYILPPVYIEHYSIPSTFGLMVGLIVYAIVHPLAKKSSKW